MIKGNAAKLLFAWMRTIYDPMWGVHYAGIAESIIGLPADGVPNFKRAVTIWQLDAHMEPRNHVVLYGCYPKAWKLAEFNYTTNEFHTIELTLRYDLSVQFTDDETDAYLPTV